MNGEVFRTTKYDELSPSFAHACFEADKRVATPQSTVKPAANTKNKQSGNASQDSSKSRLVTITARSVKPRNIDFLWAGRLAKGKHTCFAGEGGLGKSQLLIDVTAPGSRLAAHGHAAKDAHQSLTWSSYQPRTA